jgi:predicted ATPase
MEDVDGELFSSFPVCRESHDQSEDDPMSHLVELMKRELVAHGNRYLFKHALIQDAAYQSLLKRTRQQYHQQVAKLLEDRFPEVVSVQPELVAHHYTEANCPEQAIVYWHKAGVAAVSKSANVEAVDQFRRGLALVEALSDARERAERELDLQMALAPALFATKIQNHPDVGWAYARASELCQQLGDHSRGFTALRGLQLHNLNLLEMEKSQHFAEEALRVAERLDDAARLVGAHMALGVTLYCQGKLELALPFDGALTCSIRTCDFPIGRVPTPACNASSSRRSSPGCTVTRIGPSRSSGQR